jgi:hypothetical protein
MESNTTNHPMIIHNGKLVHVNNSKGHPIHHTHEGVKNFHDWFKDSKAVDDHGRPQVYYHGSISKNIKEFDTGLPNIRKSTGPAGIYLTTDGYAASNYSRNPETKERGKTYSLYLRTNNPLDITKDLKKHQKAGKTFSEAKQLSLLKLNDTHDSVKFLGNGLNHDEYIAFNSNQLKSTTDNNGVFSTKSNAITEDTEPTVAVGNGAIDTAPVVTKEQQKKITMLSRFKKLKSFKQFLEESLLLEMPEIVNVDKQDYPTRLRNSVISLHKKFGSTNGKIEIGNHTYMFHGPVDAPHSISHFNQDHPDFITHENVAKCEGGDVNKIISNIETVARTRKPVQSYMTNSKGAISLWKNVASKFPNNTYVYDRKPSVSGPATYEKVGLLNHMNLSEVWGDTNPGRRIRLEF